VSVPTPYGKCSICGKVIYYGGVYYVCSVSTCNTKRLPKHFCSWDCWDAHLPDARHRRAECIEENAPRGG
jgi:hypothetical protein